MIAALAGLAPHLAAVEQRMSDALVTDEPRVARLIDGLGSFHGKMLRPSLILLVAEASGGVQPVHIHLGAALELIHTATLIHDDLIDDAATRRSRPTAHISFGNTTAVLLGDYFYTHAFDLVAGLGDQVATKRLTETTNIICRGELHQQCAARDTTLSEDEYNRIILAKTAALTELAGELGAPVDQPAQRQAAAAYGRACGMAFQIVDDCLDFSGDPAKVGKTLSTDIERGRLTLPLIRLLQSAGEQRPAIERQLLSASTADEVQAVKRLVVASGALQAALTTARTHVASARLELSAFPAGPARQALDQLAEFIVARDF